MSFRELADYICMYWLSGLRGVPPSTSHYQPYGGYLLSGCLLQSVISERNEKS